MPTEATSSPPAIGPSAIVRFRPIPTRALAEGRSASGTSEGMELLAVGQYTAESVAAAATSVSSTGNEGSVNAIVA